MSRLDGKTAIITGSGQGIGSKIATAMAKVGAYVVVCDLTEERAAPIAKEINLLGIKALPLACDVTDEDQVKKMIKTAIAKFSRIDILVNNAGWQYVATVEDSTLEQWERTMAVNLRGPFLCSREVIPYMRQQGMGVIINISSRAGRVPKAMATAYGTSKYGLNGFTLCLNLEVAQYGIRVIALAPPRTNTPLSREIIRKLEPNADISKWSDGSDFGEIVAWFASDEASMLDGVIIESGGLRP
jgi:NAD(P)-dependent dehydrogenase (short-subunit alcohol dehydrogenase family)